MFSFDISCSLSFVRPTTQDCCTSLLLSVNVRSVWMYTLITKVCLYLRTEGYQGLFHTRYLVYDKQCHLSSWSAGPPKTPPQTTTSIIPKTTQRGMDGQAPPRARSASYNSPSVRRNHLKTFVLRAPTFPHQAGGGSPRKSSSL